MIPKSGFSTGSVRAVKALEGFLPSVSSDVACQITSLNKLSAAVRTRATRTSAQRPHDNNGLGWGPMGSGRGPHPEHDRPRQLHPTTRHLPERPPLSSLPTSGPRNIQYYPHYTQRTLNYFLDIIYCRYASLHMHVYVF